MIEDTHKIIKGNKTFISFIGSATMQTYKLTEYNLILSVSSFSRN